MPQGEEPATVRFNILSITAFVSSFLVGVTGVILGLVALNQIKNTSHRLRLHGHPRVHHHRPLFVRGPHHLILVRRPSIRCGGSRDPPFRR